MSSMLKKTGGLSFKPKVAPRRPGGAASSSQAPPASTSSSTTQAPTTEASSEAQTPSSAVAPPPVESSRREAERIPIETPKEPPEEAPRAKAAKLSAQSQPQVTTTIQPTSKLASTSTTSTVASEPTSQVQDAPTPTPSERTPQSTPTPAANGPRRQLPTAPRIERTAQPTPAPEVPALRSPPATQLDKFTPSTSSTVPATITPRPALNTPTPDPTFPTQTRVAPPTAPPSPAPVSDTIAVSAPVDEPPGTAPKKKRTYRKRKPATEAEATGAEGPVPKKRRPRKNAATEGDRTAPPEGEGSAPPVQRTHRRRVRSPTPDEDLENRTVDHTTMKMGELTKDLGIGKKFKHADAIAERAREARERFRMKKLEKQKRRLGLAPNEDLASRAGTPVEGEGNGRESAIARARDLGANASSGAQQSVGYEVIDGQIIINQQSLVVDRHAAQDMSSLETVEEDEFSHLTTSASYRRESRRTGANHWSDDDTEKFYRLLGMFGTDFETISAMFPEKTRRAVKLKFNREETLRPNRIDATVMVRGEKKVSIDLEEYKAHQAEWQERDKILAEHAALAREHDEDIRRLREERRAQGLIDDDDDARGRGGNGGGNDNADGHGNGDAGGNGDDDDNDQQPDVGDEQDDSVSAPPNAQVTVEA